MREKTRWKKKITKKKEDERKAKYIEEKERNNKASEGANMPVK